jgi:hypothetical protein
VTRHFVAFAGRLSGFATHDLIESFEVGAGSAVGKIRGCLERRDLLRHGYGHELIDTGSVFPA